MPASRSRIALKLDPLRSTTRPAEMAKPATIASGSLDDRCRPGGEL